MSYRTGLKLQASQEVVNLGFDFLSDGAKDFDDMSQRFTRSASGVLLLADGPLDATLTHLTADNPRRETLRIVAFDPYIGGHNVEPEYSLSVNGLGKFKMAHGHIEVGEKLGLSQPPQEEQIEEAYWAAIGGIMAYQANNT